MKIKLTFILLFWVFLTGCGIARINNLEKYSNNNLQFDLTAEEITILDIRSDISNSKMKIPGFPYPGQIYTHTPSLTGEDKQSLKKLINKNFQGAEPITVRIIIQDAYKKFDTQTFSGKVTAFAKIKVEVKSDTRKVWCSSTGGYYQRRLSINHEKMDRLFEVTLKNVTYKCLKAFVDDKVLKQRGWI